MKTKLHFLILTLLVITVSSGRLYSQDKVSALKDYLNELAQLSSNTFFIDHCNSFVNVIDNSKTSLSKADSTLLGTSYDTFISTVVEGNPSNLLSYTKRQRPFILSWTSPTDGKVSFSWLKLPDDWDPSKTYPLYIELHGLWNVAANPIEYLTYPFRQGPTDNYAFEDGYLLSPWGRGNYWYQGISETDIWECIAALEQKVKIDPSRKYLCGHSMGGFGAWYIGSKSVNTWAALGIHAGALGYDQRVLTTEVYESLKDVPVYFVVGNVDNLFAVNNAASQYLIMAGNPNVEFVIFNGGHEYLDENVQGMYDWMRNFTNDDWYLGIDVPGKVHQLREGMECIPNPVNKNATLVYRIEHNAQVSIDLYDLSGRYLKNLVNSYFSAGEHNLQEDFTDLQAGMYTCVFRVKDESYPVRIILAGR